MPGRGAVMSVNDRKVLEMWDDSSKLHNGHYQMNIPFMAEPPDLPDNRVMAEGCDH